MNIPLFRPDGSRIKIAHPFFTEPNQEPNERNGFTLYELILFCMVAFTGGYYIGWIHTHGVIEGKSFHLWIDEAAKFLFPVILGGSWIIIAYLFKARKK